MIIIHFARSPTVEEKCNHCEHTIPINAQSSCNSSMMNNNHMPQITSHDHLQWKNNNHHTNTHTYTHSYTNNTNKTISFCNDDTE